MNTQKKGARNGKRESEGKKEKEQKKGGMIEEDLVFPFPFNVPPYEP